MTGSAIQQGSPGANQTVQFSLNIEPARIALGAFEAAVKGSTIPPAALGEIVADINTIKAAAFEARVVGIDHSRGWKVAAVSPRRHCWGSIDAGSDSGCASAVVRSWARIMLRRFAPPWSIEESSREAPDLCRAR